MRTGIVVALLVFWIALAYREFQSGDMVMAGVFLGIGVLLTVYRLSRNTAS